MASKSVKKRSFYRYSLAVLLIILAGTYWFPVPVDPFGRPASTVLLDAEGELLGARIASDGQWRFPPSREVPERYAIAVTEFEDRYFSYHPGVNPFSLFRAGWQNIRQRRIVSGASTLTMQVVRISRPGRPRTLWEKWLEMVLAVKLELRHSKEEILAMYASCAPYGGNVVGLDAAAWRYFGTSPAGLTWSEASLLAVLPNAPALIHPGRNRDLLKAKRDRLLLRLMQQDYIDSLTYRLSCTEPLPLAPLPLPQTAPHLLDRVTSITPGITVQSTIDRRLQEQVNEILARYSNIFAQNGVHNAAALVLSVDRSEALVYAGNVPGTKHANDVDVVMALRSPGSLLKPVLFAAMLEEGSLLPGTLLPDIPTIISGYSPKNFNRTYEGAVPAKRALEKSLNVPAVRMLQDYRYERFHHLLHKMGISSLYQPPDHYGLSLILGGAEMSLWEMCGLYASMARVLFHYDAHDGRYDGNDIHDPVFIRPDEDNIPKYDIDPPLSAGTIYLTFQSLLEVNRPEEEAGWEYFHSSRKIAWKTGTSFGFRDGWAIGTTPGFVVGVWIGNADGEGRPGLTGIATAAPVMFEIFDILPGTGWFDGPYDEMEFAAVCHQSGQPATSLCGEPDSIWILPQGLNSGPCPYHQLIHTDPTGTYRVNAHCSPPDRIVARPWFVLPPVMEWYYKLKDPAYQEIPSFGQGCQPTREIPMMGFIYPENNARIFIPVELDGTPGDAVFEIAHRNPSAKVYWHLDEDYLGTTQYMHQLAFRPEKGNHRLRAVDEKGNEVQVTFWVENGGR